MQIQLMCDEMLKRVWAIRAEIAPSFLLRYSSYLKQWSSSLSQDLSGSFPSVYSMIIHKHKKMKNN